jgi:hypothetical protein
MKSDIQQLIEKYWNAESSTQEEEQLKSYLSSPEVAEEHKHLKSLFGFYELQKQVKTDFEPDLSFLPSQKPKLRFLLPKVIAIAASFLLLLALSYNWLQKSSDTMYKNKYTELEDPEEALAITLEALGYASNKIEKATKPAAHFKKVEKTAVFKFEN